MRSAVRLSGRPGPPFFCPLPLRPKAVEALARQMEGRRFDPALILVAASVCPWKGVRVLACRPLAGLRPFPTTFWLVCPWLVRRLGRLEAEGGVRSFEEWLEAGDRGEWRAYHRLHQVLRLSLISPLHKVLLRRFEPRLLERLRRGGIGGIDYGTEIRVKCLHLQTASWLALGFHPGGEWLLGAGLAGDCGGTMASLCCPGRNEQ